MNGASQRSTLHRRELLGFVLDGIRAIEADLLERAAHSFLDVLGSRAALAGTRKMHAVMPLTDVKEYRAKKQRPKLWLRREAATLAYSTA
jgi:hypothetical protein